VLDDQVREDHFSYFKDSIPRTDLVAVNKNQYGLITEPFIKRVVGKIPPPIHSPYAKINTMEPTVIYPAKPDSLDFMGDEEMMKELDVIDSAAVEVDSVQASKNWHFNLDQESYFKYLKKKLKISIEPVEEGEEGIEEEGLEPSAAVDTTGTTKERKGLKGLFKKKDKKEKEVDEPAETDPDQTSPDQQPAEKKQGN